MMLRALLFGSIALLALHLAAQQQDNSAPPPQQNAPAQTTPSTTQKKDQPKKNSSQENPFPEAQSEAAAHQAQQQNNAEPSAPEPQTAPQSGSPNKPAAADQNPFPSAQSEKAAHQAQQPDQPATSGPPRPDDQNYSSSQVKGLNMPTTEEAPPPGMTTQLPYSPRLAKKDAQIGDFYLASGNYRGAYDRFLEANHSDPGNAEAVFGLAESARHLSHADEALRYYRLYLTALPNGPHAKEVRKALKEMDAEPAS
jgi:tetratricopeptide (TPR) repeat protein